MRIQGEPTPEAVQARAASRDPPLVSVALCADKNIEVGLHVTLYSLLKYSHHRIRINLLLNGYRSHHLAKIYETLEPFNGQYELNILEANAGLFAKHRGLHGNKFCFVKLMLADFLDDDRVIYLDSDLIIQRDLGELFCSDMKGYVIAVSGLGGTKDSVERELFASLGVGLNEEVRYFNSGVMLVNLKLWRSLGITQQCVEFAGKYPQQLPGADQTVLNYVLYKNYIEVDSSYNSALYPASKPVNPTAVGKIFHFVGSPKPWDFLGEFVHPNYPLFHAVLSNTAFRNYKTYRGLTFSRVKRTLRLSRSYLQRFSKA